MARVGRKHMVMPDAQIKKGSPVDHLRWLGHYAVLKRPHVIICIGDFFDMPSLCYYDEGKKQAEGQRYEDDIAAGKAAMQEFLKPINDFNERARKNHEQLYLPELEFMLGNHEWRIKRAVDKDAKYEGKVSLDDLGLKEMGWNVHNFLTPIYIDGVAYCHYFPSGPKELPIGSAAKMLTVLHSSAVAGHKPGRDIAYTTHGDGRQMTAIISGSFYLDNQGYITGPQKHWRGFYMLHDVVDGDFDEMAVSIRYLQRKAKKEGW